MEGNPKVDPDKGCTKDARMKSSISICECLWLYGYKSSTSVEGVRSEKMERRIRDNLNKTLHPDLGCSGSLSPTVTVHFVNVGTSCFGQMTELAVAEVEHGGRESRSSPRHGRHATRRRTLASRRF